MRKNISVALSIFIISLGCTYFLAVFLDEYISLLIVLTAIGSVIITYLISVVKQLKDLKELGVLLRKTSN